MQTWEERKSLLVRDIADDAKFIYAHMWNVPPHDPALNHISEAELVIYTEARLELMNIFAGNKKPGVSTSFAEAAKQRLESAQSEDMVTVTPKELGWTDEEGGD